MINKSSRDEVRNLLHNIRWLRAEHGISKKEMAKLLGVGGDTLNRIERGEFPPRLRANVVLRIQKYFGISPQEQLTRKLGEE